MRTALVPLLLLALPIAEIAGFILVGNAIGVLPTLGLILGASVLGLLLLRHQGLETLRRVQAETRAGRVPGRALADGAVILLAGLLLVIPGFLTDVLGLLLFVPAVRALAWRLLSRRVVVVGAGASGGRFGFPRAGFPGSGSPRGGTPGAGRPDVVDLPAEDFARRPDSGSPWRANGHAGPRLSTERPAETGPGETGPAGGEGGRTLH